MHKLTVLADVVMEGCIEGGWTHGKGLKCVGMHWYTQHVFEHVQTMVGGLGKAVACGHTWVWAGAYQHGWAHISGASVQHKRAMGAHEGGGTCSIGGPGQLDVIEMVRGHMKSHGGGMEAA